MPKKWETVPFISSIFLYVPNFDNFKLFVPMFMLMIERKQYLGHINIAFELVLLVRTVIKYL